MAKRICVGTILKPVGIKGQVKIKSYTTSPETILTYEIFTIDGGKEISFSDSSTDSKGYIIASLQGYPDRTSVEPLRFKDLYIERDKLGALEKDEYYLEDLTGLDVFNQKLEIIGKVNAALDYGAGAFLDIELFSIGRDVTIPFNKDSIIDINLESQHLQVNDSYILR